MRRSIWVRLFAVALLVLAGAACGGDDEEETGSGSPTTPADDADGGDDGGGAGEGDGPIELTVTTTEYEFEIDDEIEGGIVELTLANEGEQTHEAGFIKVPDDYDIAGFEEEFGGVIEGGPIPEVFETVTGAGEAEGGQELTSTITLPEGTYVLMCSLSDEDGEGEGEGGEGEGEGGGGESGASAEDQDAEGAAEGVEEEEAETQGAPPHYTLGMLEKVTVTGGAEAAAADIESDGVVQAVDYGFEVPELEAGQHTLTFENTSEEQLHHGIFFAFPEGVDEASAAEQFKAMIAEEEGAAEPEEAGFTYVFGPGMGGTFEIELESGRTYGVVCFLQDRTGGPPHAVAHDMAEFFTVG